MDEAERRAQDKEMEEREQKSHLASEQVWADFAVLVFLLAGLMNTLTGITVFAMKSDFQDKPLLYHNLDLVGGAMIVLGLLSLLSSFLIWRRSPGGRILGIFMALLAACVWFFYIDQRPVWSIIMIAMYVLIMYTLVQAREIFKSRG